MDSTIIGSVVIGLGAVLGVFLSISQIKSSFKTELKEETTKAVELAQALALKDVEALRQEIKRLEETVEKDIAYVKQTHNSEIRNLGEKIENLRDEIAVQHSSLLALLTRLVENK